MNKNNNGFSSLVILTALLVLIVSGVAVWRISQNQETTSDITSNVAKTETQSVEYPDDWREFRRIYEGDKNTYVVFWAPRAWVDIKTASFDGRGDYQQRTSYVYFQAAAEPDFVFGAPMANYTSAERGGALTDATDFSKTDSGYVINWLNSTESQTAKGYKELSGATLPAIINYTVNHFDTEYMHAIVKVEGIVPVLNFVSKQGVLSQSEFELLVKSVHIE